MYYKMLHLLSRLHLLSFEQIWQELSVDTKFSYPKSLNLKLVSIKVLGPILTFSEICKY